MKTHANVQWLAYDVFNCSFSKGKLYILIRISLDISPSPLNRLTLANYWTNSGIQGDLRHHVCCFTSLQWLLPVRYFSGNIALRSAVFVSGVESIKKRLSPGSSDAVDRIVSVRMGELVSFCLNKRIIQCGPVIMLLTHWDRDKMTAVSQTMFSNAFSWTKMYEFR